MSGLGFEENGYKVFEYKYFEFIDEIFNFRKDFKEIKFIYI